MSGRKPQKQFYMTEDAYRTLEQLREATGTENDSALVRTALGLLLADLTGDDVPDEVVALRAIVDRRAA